VCATSLARTLITRAQANGGDDTLEAALERALYGEMRADDVDTTLDHDESVLALARMAVVARAPPLLTLAVQRVRFDAATGKASKRAGVYC
jgi:hypothetical protein